MTSGLRDPALDVLLGGRCVGCERPGRVLCAACVGTLPVTAEVRWPGRPPEGLALPFSAASYEGLVRAMVVGHKERGLAGLGPVLGDLLALSVATGVLAQELAGPLLLVPVPSRARSVRRRGLDATHALTASAAATLGAAGHRAAVARLLRLRPGVVDQAGLDLQRRHENLDGSMAVAPGVLRRWAGRRVHVVVCDDVLTTGSTAREAQRALEQVGLDVAVVACVAATPLPEAGGPVR